MNRKSVLGLTLFTFMVLAGLFIGAAFMIRQPAELKIDQSQQYSSQDKKEILAENNQQKDYLDNIQLPDVADGDDTVYPDFSEGNIFNYANTANTQSEQTNTPNNNAVNNEVVQNENRIQSGSETAPDQIATEDTNKTEDSITEEIETEESFNVIDYADDLDDTEVALSENILELPDMQLITDCTQVDYMKYIPEEMIYDSKIEVALDIENPSLDIKAKSAIVFDVKTREVLYYKNPIEPVFPASTAKLLTALVTLDWCMEEETVTVGDELDLVAPDSTIASLKKGQVLTIRNLIEGMLVPSGNDAAYVAAAYVGRKSLKNSNASLKDAIFEFIRLMNNKAKSLGAINSCFKTPDGYDAIGQYTTAYDMGLIGLAAADNETILEVCNKSTARNVFADGYDVTWKNTNSLIKKDSSRYYPYCIGLKTGTSTMAGKCLVSLAKNGEKEILSVVMNSDSEGRWEDSRKLLEYGLNR